MLYIQLDKNVKGVFNIYCKSCSFSSIPNCRLLVFRRGETEQACKVFESTCVRTWSLVYIKEDNI